jgi:hypothetical protein
MSSESRDAQTMLNPGTNVVMTNVLDQRCVCRISTTRPSNLVDLTGSGLATIGADERLCAGNHAIAQQWALALWLHPSHVDDLYYRARHDPSRYSAAIYDRAADALQAHPQGAVLNAPALLADILRTYRFALIDQGNWREDLPSAATFVKYRSPCSPSFS